MPAAKLDRPAKISALNCSGRGFFLTNREGAKDAKEEKRREENKGKLKISINRKVYPAD